MRCVQWGSLESANHTELAMRHDRIFTLSHASV